MIPHGEWRKAICFLSLTQRKFVLGVQKVLPWFLVVDLAQARCSYFFSFLTSCLCVKCSHKTQENNLIFKVDFVFVFLFHKWMWCWVNALMRATKQISRSRYQIVKTAQLVLAMHKTHVKHLQPDAAGQIFNRLKSSHSLIGLCASGKHRNTLPLTLI